MLYYADSQGIPAHLFAIERGSILRSVGVLPAFLPAAAAFGCAVVELVLAAARQRSLLLILVPLLSATGSTEEPVSQTGAWR